MKMERRVIKFNLVGAICVCILIISIIIGSIIIGVKTKKSNKTEEINTKTAAEKYSYENIDFKKDYTENIQINGENQQIVLRTSKGTFGYAIMYDKSQFYTEKNKNGKDIFSSLQSDTIKIMVSRKSGNYDDMIEKIKNSKDQEQRNGEKYSIKEDKINGANALIKTTKNAEKTEKTYCIQAKDGFFIIEMNCGANFEKTALPVMNKMVSTFQEI